MCINGTVEGSKSVSVHLPQNENIDKIISALSGLSGQLEKFFDNRIESDWMDLDEAAVYLRTKSRHLRDLVYKREIPHSKLGGLLRFHKQTLDKWLLSKERSEWPSRR
jgi:excisionase family DNA binding protein